MKYIKTYENVLEPKPSDFSKIEPSNCRINYDKSKKNW